MSRLPACIGLVALLTLAAPAVADDIGLTRVTLVEEEDGAAALFVYAAPRLTRLFPTPVRVGRGPLAARGYASTPEGGALRFDLAGAEPGTVLHLPWGRPALLFEARWRDGETVRRFLRRGPTGFQAQ